MAGLLWVEWVGECFTPFYWSFAIISRFCMLSCQGVMNYFFRNLHLHECQLDELWTFIYKKEAHLTPLEKLREVEGDAWVWIAFSPVCKLVPA